MARDNKGDNIAGAGSNVRMQEATSRKRRRKPSLVGTASTEIAVGFLDFVRNHAVVSLAVGFIIATQAQALVKQLVDSFITPTFQFFFSGALTKDTLTYHFNGRTIHYTWGIFASDIIDFILVLLVLYLIITFFKLDKLDKKPDSK